MRANVIITNRALEKIRYFGLTESQVMDAYNGGAEEEWTNKAGFNAVKKYSGYEVGVSYFKDERGLIKITTVWKRYRR